ncbi:condensin complex subunit 2-like isoform X2 [Phoenix dactylifera]|uniref:Condensin complex subunit 2 n=1 Tax=Phoenix dactylifera TaxID=42345 RepID=A0A8B8J3C0_PHODC|nr:condensin complex subunit 2-like isoform X2 [Phoenix dactylifera]
MGEETEEEELYRSQVASIPPQRGALPMASRLQYPTPHPHFFLGSNDDQLERAQSRAARSAAIRLKSSALHPPPPFSSSDRPGFFDTEQIMELYHNCLRLASENKINQKNTWELGLIDHLSEIIRVEAQDDNETNFQKASCTLEAGVKIYSLRVDSVHSEAYKVLGGINRASQEDDNENLTERNVIRTEQEGHISKDLDKKVSPLSTLESSYEALNVKKFGVAFTVDPLYHQTSAQFDEGGAKGLLLNNLGVYGSCHIHFASSEAPEMSIMFTAQTENSELIDLSFAKEFVEQMTVHMPAKHDISPTLSEIVNQFDQHNGRPSDVCSVGQRAVLEDVVDNFQIDLESNAFENNGPWSFEYDDHTSVIDDTCISTDQNCISDQEECDIDEKLGNLADLLPLGLGFSSKHNAWAGPDHWKYQKTKGQEQKVSTNNSELATKRSKIYKKCDSDISFANYVEDKIPDIFYPPKNPRLISLPGSRVACNIMLPEDRHYKPENLVRLFICPNVLCLGKKRRKPFDVSRQENHSFNPMPSWDCESMTNDRSNDRHVYSDEDDPDTLVCQPRQVNKVDVQYDKVAKQVDVQLLKEVIWNQIQNSIEKSETECEAIVSFRQILQQFPHGSPAAPPNKMSPHLVFICLLHLANEHCLNIQDRTSLDELDIKIPLSALV